MSEWVRAASCEADAVCFEGAGGARLVAPALIGGRYAVVGVLSASGGFGVIYNAEDRRLRDRRVLVKARRYEPWLFRFPNDGARDEEIARRRRQTRFEWECLLHFRRQGESRIPNVNDVCEDYAPCLRGPHAGADGPWRLDDDRVVRNEPYIIAQAIPGESLHDRIARREHEPHWEKMVLQLALELCTILGGFHRVGRARGTHFIYQDLKPANIIVSHDEFFTLIDFGAMTLVMDDASGRPCSHWNGLGSPGLGTWGYKAPEMNPAKGLLRQLDRRVDVYALGATLFHLLTGEDPSQQPNEYGPLPSGRLKPRSPVTAEVVLKALQPEREHRYEHMAAMRQHTLQALKDLRQR